MRPSRTRDLEAQRRVLQCPPGRRRSGPAPALACEVTVREKRRLDILARPRDGFGVAGRPSAQQRTCTEHPIVVQLPTDDCPKQVAGARRHRADPIAIHQQNT
jgi:hypothetical protein